MKPYYLYTDINSGLRWHLVLASENSINFVESDFVEPMSIEEYTSIVVGSVAVEIPSAEELFEYSFCESAAGSRHIEMLREAFDEQKSMVDSQIVNAYCDGLKKGRNSNG